MATYDTAVNIINDAAVELGISTQVLDAYGSIDPNIIQLVAFLKSAGRKVLHERIWTTLTKQYTFTTVADQTDYALPTDFRMMIDQTGWVRTTRFPLGGPMSPQEWQFLKAQMTGVTFTILFRPQEGIMKLFDNTPADQLIAYEYVSNYWTRPVDQTEPTREAPSQNSDTIMFDAFLMVRALKLEFLKAKGMDSTTAQSDYEEALEMIKGDDAMAPIIRLDGNRFYEVRLLDAQNIPITGFGS